MAQKPPARPPRDGPPRTSLLLPVLVVAGIWAVQLVRAGLPATGDHSTSLEALTSPGHWVLAATGVERPADAADQPITVTPEGSDEPGPITVTPETPEDPGPITVTPEPSDEPLPITVTPEPAEPTDLNPPTVVAPTTVVPPTTPPPPPTTPPPSPAPTPGILANISTRGFVGTGDDVLIPGFIVQGGPLRVVLRARGPSFAATVPGALGDPQMYLVRQTDGKELGRNDNWSTGNCKTEVPQGFWPTDPRESCLVAVLDPGGYSFVISGVAATTGVGLGEVFRVDGSGMLANISTRGLVQPEPKELIAGLIVQKGPAKVVIRGQGPKLPVRGPLCDPQLTLYDSSQKVLAKNNNWGDGPVPPPGFPPADPKDALIAITLPPGSYTAVLGSAQRCTGVGLVEAFVVAP